MADKHDHLIQWGSDWNEEGDVVVFYAKCPHPGCDERIVLEVPIDPLLESEPQIVVALENFEDDDQEIVFEVAEEYQKRKRRKPH